MRVGVQEATVDRCNNVYYIHVCSINHEGGGLKGERLGEFEELVLLCVRRLGGDAHGAAIQRTLAEHAGREVTKLLDAAHIVKDKDPEGRPVVSNGLSLCKLHHAAFDANFIGIRPDYVVEVRADVLDEEDGPMLLHGLKEMHRVPLEVLPRKQTEKPDPAMLEKRYEEFRGAA